MTQVHTLLCPVEEAPDHAGRGCADDREGHGDAEKLQHVERDCEEPEQQRELEVETCARDRATPRAEKFTGRRRTGENLEQKFFVLILQLLLYRKENESVIL